MAENARYTATPAEGELPRGCTTTIWYSFEIQASGKCKPSVSVGIVTPTDEVDDQRLADISLVAAKALRIGSLLGKRWAWQYANAPAPVPTDELPPEMVGDVIDHSVRISTREEILGWLVERTA